MSVRLRPSRGWHLGIVALGLVPAAVLAADALGGRLGANPIEELAHRTGDWTIWLLLATLAVTPLRGMTGWPPLIRFRRTVGLLAFGYACTHFLTYLVLDQGFLLDPAFTGAFVLDDIAKRPYITLGVSALTLLVPLALTSTRAAIRRLGGKRWNVLHRLIYVAAACAVLHYLWLVKGDQPKPIYHGLVLVALLSYRVWAARRRAAAPGPAPADALALPRAGAHPDPA